MRFKTECLEATIDVSKNEHTLILKQTDDNTGMFGSKIIDEQFKKIETVLCKRYIKLPFGIKLLI